jgi:2-phospho-L-lactate/phosphoenolpyruvate guanylyltransferase
MIWAIVPVKPLLLGKSRLAGVVPSVARSVMNRMMLEHTLSVLRDTQAIAETVVISRDPEALAIAREFHARTLLEQGGSQLNSALERATAVVATYQPHGLLILPADLPLLTVDDLQAVLEATKTSPAVVVAPDRHDRGTNALLTFPPGKISYRFGFNSFSEHCRGAQEAGVNLFIVRRQALGIDLDLPEDLELLRELQRPHTKPLIDNISTYLPAASSREEVQ